MWVVEGGGKKTMALTAADIRIARDLSISLWNTIMALSLTNGCDASQALIVTLLGRTIVMVRKDRLWIVENSAHGQQFISWGMLVHRNS